jgi:hypothetical protein
MAVWVLSESMDTIRSAPGARILHTPGASLAGCAQRATGCPRNSQGMHPVALPEHHLSGHVRSVFTLLCTAQQPYDSKARAHGFPRIMHEAAMGDRPLHITISGPYKPPPNSPYNERIHEKDHSY